MVLKKSLWPWLMAIVAILSQHIEFLLSQNFNLGDDSVGKLAYANLILLGITSAFFAFQNFTLTRYSDGTLTAAKINQYQLLAIGVMLVACAIAFMAVQFLHFIMPDKFDNLFIHYSILMIIKLVAWSTICIKGSLLYYYGYSAASFYIGCLPLGGAIMSAFIFKTIDSVVYAQVMAYAISAIILHSIFKGRIKNGRSIY